MYAIVVLCTPMHTPELIGKTTQNLRDTLTIALEHTEVERALVVYDTHHPLTQLLTEGYRQALPHAQFMDYDEHAKEAIIAAFDTLAPRDLVVLVQSGDFRLNDFRIRIQLFQRGLKVIDHRHLARHVAETWETYVEALAYDPSWYRTVGPRLKEILSTTTSLRILSDAGALTVNGPLEVPKLNIGDYTGMDNIGGTFPIGEVFTEAQDLATVNGSLQIYAFANPEYMIETHEPFTIRIEAGVLVGWDERTPDSFISIVEQVQAHERPLMREIGFGLNRAITRKHPLHDITAFERTLGLHFSLGEKHTVFKKAGITADKTRFHVDLFPVVTEVLADNVCIFKDGVYLP